MIDTELAAFAADGRALIVGAVDDEGAPHATRGWGFRLEADGTARVVLDAEDGRGIRCLAGGSAIAVTATDVRTLESRQFKGTSTEIVEPDEADLAAVDHYLEMFFDEIVATDGTPRPVLDRIVPSRYVACRFHVERVFDQTPGPDAGRAVGARR